MDYTIEYALMSELYDERLSEATEGMDLDYIRTHHGIGKVGAALKLIWHKILEILGRIISFIPRLILKLFAKDSPMLGSAFSKVLDAGKIASLAGQRYSEIYSKVERISRAAASALQTKKLEAITKCRNEMQLYAKHAADLEDWTISYATNTAADLSRKCASMPKLSVDEAVRAGHEVWDTVLSAGDFKKNISKLGDLAKELESKVKRLESDPNVSEDFTREAFALITAFNQVVECFTSSMVKSKDKFNEEWERRAQQMAKDRAEFEKHFNETERRIKEEGQRIEKEHRAVKQSHAGFSRDFDAKFKQNQEAINKSFAEMDKHRKQTAENFDKIDSLFDEFERQKHSL